MPSTSVMVCAMSSKDRFLRAEDGHLGLAGPRAVEQQLRRGRGDVTGRAGRWRLPETGEKNMPCLISSRPVSDAPPAALAVAWPRSPRTGQRAALVRVISDLGDYGRSRREAPRRRGFVSPISGRRSCICGCR